jgi:cyanate permease
MSETRARTGKLVTLAAAITALGAVAMPFTPLTRKWICAKSISVGILGMGLVLAWDRSRQPTIPARLTAGRST